MTSADLDALEKLADEATPGPWGYDETNTPFYNDPDGRSCGGEATGFGEVVQDDDIDTIVIERARIRDAAFVAAANPATIKALIAELKEARQAIKPLADCEIIEPDQSLADDITARYLFSMGEIRAARAFLARNGKGEG